MCKFPVELRSGMGHTCIALDIERKQGMRRSPGGPCLLAGAEEPNGIGGKAGGLGGTGDLDRRIAGFGSKKCRVEGACQGREKLLPACAAAVEAERTAILNGLIPAAGCLNLGA